MNRAGTSRSRRGATRQLVGALLAVSVAACTTAEQESQSTTAAEGNTLTSLSGGNTAMVTFTNGEALHVTLPGIATLEAPSGALTGQGSIEVTQVTADTGDPMLTPAGSGVHVQLTGVTLTSPVTVRFPVTPSPTPDSQPVFVHVADDGATDVASARYAAGEIVGDATQFSSIIPAWLDPRQWTAWLWDAVMRGATGRTEALNCANNAPNWGSISGPASDIVHTCTITNSGPSGAPRYEVQLKSNRGTFSEVVVPNGATYIWVENQPDVIRKALVGAGWENHVLLRPGGMMTIGYNRPPSAAEIHTIHIEPTNTRAMVLTLGFRLLDLYVDHKIGDNALPFLAKFYADCSLGLNLGSASLPSAGTMFDVAKCFLGKLVGSWNDTEAVIGFLSQFGPRMSVTPLAKGGSLLSKVSTITLMVPFLQAGWGPLWDGILLESGIASDIQVTLLPPSTAPPTTQATTPPTASTAAPPTGSPPPVSPTSPPDLAPTITAFDAIPNANGSVQLLASISWQSGTDPITCTFTADGATVLSQQCGNPSSYTFIPSPGTHTFQLKLCNRWGTCASSNPVTRTIGSAPQPPPIPATTYNETTGGVANTWSNYANAGGTAGPQIAKNATVAVSCRLQGFKVADGNTWWYRIASAPWSNAYYVSADVFYNNGQTSGSLSGTPFFDPAVPLC